MFCSECGKFNDEQASFCSGCGKQLAPAAAEAVPNRVELFSTIIGPKNQEYYLRHFARFERQGKVEASWHWPALFVTFYWFLYRKMWAPALVYFFAPVVFVIAFGALTAAMGIPVPAASGLANIFLLAVLFVVMPMYANGIYYRHCRKKIDEVMAGPGTTPRKLGELAARGGTSNIAIIVVVVIGVIFSIGILAAIAIPQYNEYRMKAQISEAVQVGSSATAPITAYIDRNRAIPASLDQAGFKAQLPRSVRSMAIDGDNGVVTVMLEGAMLSGKRIVFVPQLDEKDAVVWRCSSDEVPQRLLPPKCRDPK